MQNEEYSAKTSEENSTKTGEKSSAKSREKKSGGKKALGQEEDSRRNELIAKSAQLFREKGYEKTTVRDIAAAVGMQAGSWFYHFKSKQEILLAIMEQGMQQSLAEIEKIASQDLPPRAMFRELVQAHLNTLLAPNHDFITVILYEGRSLDAEGRAKVAALTNQYQAVWEKVIVALHESGDWALPGKLDRLLLFGSLNWTAQWYRGGVGLSVEQLAGHAVSFLLRTPEPKV